MEDDLEEQRQYSRRNFILIHGRKEEQHESTDEHVIDVLKNMDLQISKDKIDRCHRMGRRSTDKARPIIVKFGSYRQKKLSYDNKKKLKGKGIFITECLTRERHTLLKKCFDAYGKDKVYTYDGRIYCFTGDTDSHGHPEKIVITRDEDLC